MLRRAILLVFFATASFSLSSCQKATNSPDQEIRSVLEAQADAWNRGDVKAYMQAGYLNSPDLLFVGKDIRRGFEPVLARYVQRYPDAAHMGKLTFSNVEVHPLDADHAWVLGQWHLQRTGDAGGDVGGWYTLILQKTGQGWRIIADHTS